MERLALTVQKRDEYRSGKVGRLRKADFIPAVVYGKKFKALGVKIDSKNTLTLKKINFSENTLIDLHIQGEKEKIAVLIKDLQFHPLTDEVIHIDFIHVSLTDKIKVKVPIKIKGESPGVKDGGMLEYLLKELELECIPTEIPECVDIDISSLKLGDSIHVKDLTLSSSLRILTPETDAIISVVSPEEEKPAEAAAEGAATEPEVIKEKPKTEEAEAGKEAKDSKKETKEPKKEAKETKKEEKK